MSRKNSGVRALAFAVVLLSLGIPAHVALAQTKAKAATPPKPKITAKQAEAAAAKKIGGTVLSSKYEFEDNRWQYAVIIKDKKGQMYEVEVNSTTGKIMDTEKTSAAKEAREEAADRKKAAAGGKEKGEKDESDEKPEKPGQ